MEQLFETEKQKWLTKSYIDLKKLNAIHDPFNYSVKLNDQEYPVSLLLLESTDEYVHPCLTVSDCENRKGLAGLFINFRHECSTDWVVDRDNTVHA